MSDSVMGSFEAEAFALYKTYGNPNGTDYEQGQNDMGARMVALAKRADTAIAALSAAPTGEVEPVECPACYRGEVFGLSLDDGFWVEMGAVAGGANEHGANGWIELIEHYPDGRNVRREYVAKDSPLYAHPHRLTVEEVEPTLFWDAEDWENGGSDPAEVVGNYAPGEVVKVDTAIHGPTRWGVMSPDGEVRVFPSADEAEAWFQSTILAAQEPRP